MQYKAKLIFYEDGEWALAYSCRGIKIVLDRSVPTGYFGRYNVRSYKTLQDGRKAHMGVSSLKGAKEFIDNLYLTGERKE